MNTIDSLLTVLASKFDDYNRMNTVVSKSSVGWHLEHSLKAIDQIVTACKKSDSTTYRWKFKLNRYIIIDVLHKIPRGKARAPKVVQPEGEISKESLQLHLEKVQQNLENWEDLNENCYFFHPFFGDLNKKSTEKFLVLHTKHHLKIIEDICN
ncbi:DUF1569 domain-containing protein [Flavobacterium sp.]|jgi:hypothetical protein|uniref:DUF1569 domain-containing protein n=1 Tax=Flavobacterium sp. TaxID=239 RepID=UPI0037BFD498